MFTLLKNYCEFTFGLIGLLLVLGVIIAFGAAGWPGDINTCYKSPGNCYCENIDQKNPESSAILRDPGMFAQPVNTWTNVGFMLVGLAMLWWIGWERTTGRQAPHRNRITDGTLFATLYGGFTVFLGPGSMFFHASMRLWAGWFDVMSMNFFLAFVPAYNFVRRFSWPNWAGVVIYSGLVVIEGVLDWVDPDHSLIFFAVLGVIAIASQVVVAFSSKIHTATSGKVWFGVGVGVFATAFLIWWLSWTNGPLCDPSSLLQGHGAWHLLSAAAVGCLYMYFRAEEGEQPAEEGEKDAEEEGDKKDMIVLRFILGCLLGGGVGFGTGYLLGDQILQTDSTTALIVGAVMGVIAGVYSAFAMASRIYTVGVFSILGYIIDVTWSLLNSLAGLAVWIPAALISGANFCTPTDDSQRSGTFVYDKNPRGGGFLATTIGTVIAGGWCSHEEIHVWQARLYGPAYLLIYLLSFVFNFLFQLPFRRDDLLNDAYYRVCFEEWAYWGGNVSGTDEEKRDINWGGWIGGFFLTLLYCSLILSIPLGIALDQTILWAVGAGGLVLYTLIRAALPRGHGEAQPTT